MFVSCAQNVTVSYRELKDGQCVTSLLSTFYF